MITLRTIWLYVGRQFLFWFVVVFCALLALIAAIDAIELLRRAAGKPDVGIALIATMSMLRLPFLGQELTAFAVLFGAIMAFLRLTRSHELVIFRTSGISVWQFLLPALLIAGAVGVVKVMLVNPVSAFALAQYQELEGEYLTGRSSLLALSSGGSLWLRQVDEDRNQAVIFANTVDPDALELSGVEVTLLDGQDHFEGRINAERARLGDGNWELSNAWLARPNATPEFREHYALPTDLTREKIHESFASPETVSFWRLPQFIRALEATGFSALGHRLQWNALLAEPFLLIAMVLIAATVSLRFARQGGLLTLIGFGISAGFGVFIFTAIIHALGLGATLPILLAAWAPAGVTLMLGVSMLLHLEDG